MVLIVTPIAAPLYRLELGEFLFPIAQHMRLHTAEFTDFSDGEVTLGRDRRQRLFAGVFRTGFHRRKAPLRPSASGWHGKSRRVEP